MAKIGLIGAGAFSDFCLTSYKKYLPEVSCVAVFDQNLATAQALAAQHNIPDVAATVDELLALPTDAVLVLTPPNTHYLYGRTVLESGKSALIEKPLAFTLTEAQELQKMAEDHQEGLIANLVLRYHPFHQQLRTVVTSGQYGQLTRMMTTANLAEYPKNHWYWDKAVSGGFFLNTFVHFLDLYSFVGGQRALAAAHRGSVDEKITITATFPDFTAELTADVHSTNEAEQVITTYYFEQATITVEGWLPERMTIAPRGEAAVSETDPLTKTERYQQILSAILHDLLFPPTHPTIQPADLVEAVRLPLLAEANVATTQFPAKTEESIAA